MRGVPDIAFQAYAGTNVIVNGVLTDVAGTSLSSPLFVGSFARLQSIHANTVGFPAAYFYEYGALRPAAAFHDITSGSNGAYTASTGWDYVTGWGSLDVAALETVMSGYEFDKAVMTEESVQQTGAINGFAVGEGSMSPAKTTNGYTYAAFADLIAPRGPYINTYLSVSGFASDPGATWLASATAQGATLMGSKATYSYSAGTAKWKWILAHGIFDGVGTTNCWIAHK
jgi:subtilase family serine protease